MAGGKKASKGTYLPPKQGVIHFLVTQDGSLTENTVAFKFGRDVDIVSLRHHGHTWNHSQSHQEVNIHFRGWGLRVGGSWRGSRLLILCKYMLKDSLSTVIREVAKFFKPVESQTRMTDYRMTHKSVSCPNRHRSRIRTGSNHVEVIVARK